MKRVLLILIPVILIVMVIFMVSNMNKSKPSFNAGSGNSGSASVLLTQANGFEVKGNLLEAKNIYQKLINDFPGSRDIMNWQKKSEDLNIKILFSPILSPQSILYEIRPGDTLNKIAREHKTTTELIMKSNNLSSDKIVPEKKIKIWIVPFSIFVDKSQNILILKSADELIKTYTVSTGKNNSTPVGIFKVNNKITNPTWFKAGAVVSPDSPENVLGTRWLGFNLSGYGIHGTIEPQSLGQQVTQGCVRMANLEVEELYIIVPEGTEVTIVD